ncbi:MAG: hypothetical protein ACJ77K_14620 [Bacteroidia bacterium]
MKNILLLAGIFVLASCGTPAKKQDTAEKDTAAVTASPEPVVDLTVPAIPAGYKKMDLKKIGLKATLMVPKDADNQQSTLDDNEGARNEYIVYAFNVMSGDSSLDAMGGVPGEIEIYTTSWTLQQHKDRIRSSSISGFNKFLQENPDSFIYSTTPRNTSNQPLRAKDKDVYQFLILKKGADGKQYCIRSSDSFDLTSEEMLKLLAIAKTAEL